MKPCKNHPETPTGIFCQRCGAPICKDCIVRQGDGMFCSQKCADTLSLTQTTIRKLEMADKAIRRNKALFFTIVVILLAGIFALVKSSAIKKWLDSFLGGTGRPPASETTR